MGGSSGKDDELARGQTPADRSAQGAELHSHFLADRRGGMNTQAHLLLQAMSHEEIELPRGFFLMTHPYCNCREMGFVLSLYRPHAAILNLAFFEHRNSDMLCALRWEGSSTPISGAVTADDVPEAVYPDKWTLSAEWPCLSLSDAIEWTRAEIRAAIAAAKAAGIKSEGV